MYALISLKLYKWL